METTVFFRRALVFTLLALTTALPVFADGNHDADKGGGAGRTAGTGQGGLTPDAFWALRALFRKNDTLVGEAVKDIEALRTQSSTSKEFEETVRGIFEMGHSVNGSAKSRFPQIIKSVLASLLQSDGVNLATQKRAKIAQIAEALYKEWGNGTADGLNQNIARLFPEPRARDAVMATLNQLKAEKGFNQKLIEKLFDIADEKNVDRRLMVGILTSPELGLTPDIAGAMKRLLPGMLPPELAERVRRSSPGFAKIIDDEQGQQSLLTSMAAIRDRAIDSPQFADAVKGLHDTALAHGRNYYDIRDFINKSAELNPSPEKAKRVVDLSENHYFEVHFGMLPPGHGLDNLINEPKTKDRFMTLLRGLTLNAADSKEFEDAAEKVYALGKEKGVDSSKLLAFLVGYEVAHENRDKIAKLTEVFGDLADPVKAERRTTRKAFERRGLGQMVDDAKDQEKVAGLVSTIRKESEFSPKFAQALKDLVAHAKAKGVTVDALVKGLNGPDFGITGNKADAIRFAELAERHPYLVQNGLIENPAAGARGVQNIDAARKIAVDLSGRHRHNLDEAQVRKFFGAVDKVYKQMTNRGGLRVLEDAKSGLTEDQKKAAKALSDARELPTNMLLDAVVSGVGHETGVNQIAVNYVFDEFLASHGIGGMAVNSADAATLARRLRTIQSAILTDPAGQREWLAAMDAILDTAQQRKIDLDKVEQALIADPARPGEFWVQLSDQEKRIVHQMIQERKGVRQGGGNQGQGGKDDNQPLPNLGKHVPPALDMKDAGIIGTLKNIPVGLKQLGTDGLIRGDAEGQWFLQRLIHISGADLSKAPEAEAFDQYVKELAALGKRRGIGADKVAAMLAGAMPNAQDAAGQRAKLARVARVHSALGLPPPNGNGTPPPPPPPKDNQAELKRERDYIMKVLNWGNPQGQGVTKLAETEPEYQAVRTILTGLVTSDVEDAAQKKTFEEMAGVLFSMADKKGIARSRVLNMLLDQSHADSLGRAIAPNEAKVAILRRLAAQTPPPQNPPPAPPPKDSGNNGGGQGTKIGDEDRAVIQGLAKTHGLGKLIEGANPQEAEANMLKFRNHLVSLLPRGFDEKNEQHAAQFKQAVESFVDWAGKRGVSREAVGKMLTDRSTPTSFGNAFPGRRGEIIQQVFRASPTTPPPPPKGGTPPPVGKMPPPGDAKSPLTAKANADKTQIDFNGKQFKQFLTRNGEFGPVKYYSDGGNYGLVVFPNSSGGLEVSIYYGQDPRRFNLHDIRMIGTIQPNGSFNPDAILRSFSEGRNPQFLFGLRAAWPPSAP